MWVAVSRRHSDLTAALPRRKKQLAPRFDLIWPKTALAVPLALEVELFAPVRREHSRPHQPRRNTGLSRGLCDTLVEKEESDPALLFVVPRDNADLDVPRC
jgi:hypothetical protein